MKLSTLACTMVTSKCITAEFRCSPDVHCLVARHIMCSVRVIGRRAALERSCAEQADACYLANAF